MASGFRQIHRQRELEYHRSSILALGTILAFPRVVQFIVLPPERVFQPPFFPETGVEPFFPSPHPTLLVFAGESQRVARAPTFHRNRDQSRVEFSEKTFVSGSCF
jgi:hypothetical protein